MEKEIKNNILRSQRNRSSQNYTGRKHNISNDSETFSQMYSSKKVIMLKKNIK